MKGIVSTTLSGNSADMIHDALTSVVHQVDACLLIDTGITDDTVRVASDICGDKFILNKFRWRDDFSAARNFALRCAEEMGFDWAITVDTDERMLWDPGFDLKKRLSEFPGVLLLAPQVDGSYCKERVFRLPTDLRYAGYTHEGLRRVVSGSILTGVRFSELPKSPEQLKIKNERDIRLLQDYLKVENAPRWWFHLGTALHGEKRYDEAVEAYERCAEFRGWAEESSWACYMAAECRCHQGRYPEAAALAALGFSLRPQSMELAWLCGYAWYQARQYEAAIAWSKIAIQVPPDHNRISFRNVRAQTEGPWEVLYFSHHALGHTAEAADAKHEWFIRSAARRELEAAGRPGPGAAEAGGGGDGDLPAGVPSSAPAGDLRGEDREPAQPDDQLRAGA